MRYLNFLILIVALSVVHQIPSASFIGGSVEAQGFLDKVKKTLKKSNAAENITGLSEEEIAAGLRDALKVGTETVVNNLGTVDGFNLDEAIHIPLPNKLKRAKSALDKIGMSKLGDDLELKLNRAAEVATPKAKALFQNAVETMTLDDVLSIYNGPTDAATQYFREKMTPSLIEAMKPVIDDSLAEVGAVQSYDAFIGRYKDIPFVPNLKADLSEHVMERALDGVFHYVAIEEAAIRSNPVKRTTDILKKVFTK
jgi:hypothetical protein